MSDEPPRRVMSGEEFTERFREAAAPTAADVPITSSGERLDTKERRPWRSAPTSGPSAASFSSWMPQQRGWG